MEQPDTANTLTTLTVATFNLENWGQENDEGPSLQKRIELTRPQLIRLEADVLCLQEIHAQGEAPDRELSALDELLAGTPYAEYERAVTRVQGEDYPYAERNLIVLSRYPILASDQYRNDYAPAPAYQPVTADPRDEEAEPVRWERPIQHVCLELPERGDPTKRERQRMGERPRAPPRTSSTSLTCTSNPSCRPPYPARKRTATRGRAPPGGQKGTSSPR